MNHWQQQASTKTNEAVNETIRRKYDVEDIAFIAVILSNKYEDKAASELSRHAESHLLELKRHIGAVKGGLLVWRLGQLGLLLLLQPLLGLLDLRQQALLLLIGDLGHLHIPLGDLWQHSGSASIKTIKWQHKW